MGCVGSVIASPTSTTVFDTATGETTVDSENEDNAPSDESEEDDQRIYPKAHLYPTYSKPILVNLAF